MYHYNPNVMVQPQTLILIPNQQYNVATSTVASVQNVNTQGTLNTNLQNITPKIQIVNNGTLGAANPQSYLLPGTTSSPISVPFNMFQSSQAMVNTSSVPLVTSGQTGVKIKLEPKDDSDWTTTCSATSANRKESEDSDQQSQDMVAKTMDEIQNLVNASLPSEDDFNVVRVKTEPSDFDDADLSYSDSNSSQDKLKCIIRKLAKEILQLKEEHRLLKEQNQKMFMFLENYYSNVILQIFKKMAGMLVHQCSLCGKSFSSEKGPSCQKCGRTWECTLCAIQFDNKENYHRHMVRNHSFSSQSENTQKQNNQTVTCQLRLATSPMLPGQHNLTTNPVLSGQHNLTTTPVLSGQAGLTRPVLLLNTLQQNNTSTPAWSNQANPTITLTAGQGFRSHLSGNQPQLVSIPPTKNTTVQVKVKEETMSEMYIHDNMRESMASSEDDQSGSDECSECGEPVTKKIKLEPGSDLDSTAPSEAALEEQGPPVTVTMTTPAYGKPAGPRLGESVGAITNNVPSSQPRPQESPGAKTISTPGPSSEMGPRKSVGAPTTNIKSSESGPPEPVKLRFKPMPSKDHIESLEQTCTEQASDKQTAWGIRLLRGWLVENGYNEKFEEMESSELNEHLRYFYGSLQTKRSTNYSKTSLVGIRAAVSRHLSGPPYNRPFNIKHDPVFRTSNQVLLGMINALKCKGKNVTLNMKVIAKNDIEKLYSSGVFGLDNPATLQNKVFWDLMSNFNRRGQKGLHTLTKSAYRRFTDDKGLVYYRMVDENEDENDNGTDSRLALLHSRMYAKPGDPNCPVQSFEMYLKKLSPQSDAFFQHQLKYPKATCWYAPQRLGKNTLSQMMARISAEAGLSTRYTNHSITATATFLKHIQIGIADLHQK